MITKVVLRRIFQEKSLLHDIIYTPKDITNELEMPIINHERLDDVLDTTQISLLNYESEPIQSFTKMIITLTDTVGDISTDYYIYRYFEKDSVVNVCMGNQPIYRHNLSLIEITKELERSDCCNLTFTNYLSYNYGADKLVDFKYKIETNNQGIDLSVTEPKYYPTSDRIYGPNQKIGTDISSNIKLTMQAQYYKDLFNKIIGKKSYADLSLKDFYIQEPDGNQTNLLNSENYTYNKIGTHIIHQIYEYGDKIVVGNIWCQIDIFWVVNIYENFEPREYTILDVLSRLLSVCKTRRIGIEQSKYKIDPKILERLELSQLSPEFTFTNGTLFENLSLIGSYINAIPRLLPSIQEEIIDDNGNIICERDDFSNWNLISFDFLEEHNDEYSIKNLSIYEAASDMNDFAINFTSNVQNSTNSNYEGNITVTEPFIGGAISTRTESVNFEISNDEAIIKTRFPIRSIKKVMAKCSNLNVDITNRIKEKSKYDLMPAYTETANIRNNKAFYLYFIRGTKNIYGLNYKRPRQTWLETFFNDIAIKNILNIEKNNTESVPSYIKDLSFEIEYIPYVDFKLKQFKEYIDDADISNSLNYNQQANQVDIDAFGEYLKSVILKTGNPEIPITTYFDNYFDLPQLGQNYLNNYRCFSIDCEIYCFTPIKSTINWTNYYNKVAEYNALKKEIREYEISEESENRNLDYQEFCVVDTKLDVGVLFDEQESESSSGGIKFNFSKNEFNNQINVTLSGKYFQKNFQISSEELLQSKQSIINELSKTGFGTEMLLNQFSNKFINNLDYPYKSLSYAIVKTENSNAGEISSFLVPISCFSAGNSILLNFSTDDNYSAGTTSINTQELEQEDNPNDSRNKIASFSYNLENYIPYCDEHGQFKKMYIAFGSNEPIKNFNNNLIDNSKELYKIKTENLNIEDLIVDFGAHPFYIDKDSREKISFTIQLNFVTTNRNIILGKALSHTMPITGDVNTQYALVIFKSKPHRFSEYVELDSYVFNEGYCNIGDIVLGDGSVIPGQTVKCNGFLTSEVSIETRSIKFNSTFALTDGVGYGIIDNMNRLVLYVDKVIKKGEKTEPLYLMFRTKV